MMNIRKATFSQAVEAGSGTFGLMIKLRLNYQNPQELQGTRHPSQRPRQSGTDQVGKTFLHGHQCLYIAKEIVREIK